MSIIHATKINKSFGITPVLTDVSFTINKDDRIGIVGANGAGKSTLMKTLYGLIPFDSGTVRLAGNPVHFKKPADAIAMGIGMVHQEIELISQYAVWENVPGAFSSNKGADFKAVLEAVIGVIEPTAEVSAPDSGRWPMQTAIWETDGHWLTELSTRNISEYPNAAAESTLSQILQVEVPEKYYLSPKACQGILRRAAARGKELPEMLKAALEHQAVA